MQDLCHLLHRGLSKPVTGVTGEHPPAGVAEDEALIKLLAALGKKKEKRDAEPD